MKTFITLTLFELKRGVRKKSFYALLALLAIPLAIAVYAHYQLTLVAKERLFTEAAIVALPLDRLWATLLGVENLPPQLLRAAPYVAAIQTLSLSGLAWLIAVMYGGDLIASDLRDKLLHLIVIRPVSRTTYILSKLVSVTGLLAILYAVAGIVAYTSGYLLVGIQRGLLESVAYAVLIGMGVLPLLLVSALIGTATRSPTVGFIGGIVVYFVSIIITSLVALLVYGLPRTLTEITKYTELLMYANAANPFTAGSEIPRSLYAAIHHNGKLMAFAPAGLVLTINAWRLLEISLASWIISTVVLAAGLWALIAKRDL